MIIKATLQTSNENFMTTEYENYQRSRSKTRRGKRRRRLMLTALRTMFWSLILAGVFILGLGYGRIMSNDTKSSDSKVTINRKAQPVKITIPSSE